MTTKGHRRGSERYYGPRVETRRAAPEAPLDDRPTPKCDGEGPSPEVWAAAMTRGYSLLRTMLRSASAAEERGDDAGQIEMNGIRLAGLALLQLGGWSKLPAGVRKMYEDAAGELAQAARDATAPPTETVVETAGGNVLIIGEHDPAVVQAVLRQLGIAP